MGCIGFRPMRKILRRWRTTVYILGAFLLLQVCLNIVTNVSDKNNQTKSMKVKDEHPPHRIGTGKVRLPIIDIVDENVPDIPIYAPECDVTLADARSAISRAKSNRCKQEISDVACKMQNSTLLPTAIPRYCPQPIADLKPAQAPKLENEDGIVPARICYMLVVHGRAFRQFSRLLKAIYHERHYYYIHVDKRSDYLYRQIKEQTAIYPNVRLTKWRMSTIWGGASLLQMLLRSIKEALLMWEDWDFFINLSALDFPIQSDDSLSKYLSVHREKSFLKSHGRPDEKKFIKKQGLNRVFVECDEHMWRLGPRTIPEGIKITGGSDWLALNRELCLYAINSNDQLVYDLKDWYAYTLLPVESFFHTLAHNREKCDSFVDNNLRVTNWNRARGCKCQYKHIVDWCGCSPNDFFPSDMGRLKTTRPVFFARKFEESVNQEVINILDFKIYGEYPAGTPSLNSYWENTYDHIDGMSSISDVIMTTYSSFGRLGLDDLHRMYGDKLVRKVQRQEDSFSECRLHLNEIVHVEMYKRNEEFIGYVVTMKASFNHHLQQQMTFQTLVSARPLLRIIDTEHQLATRLQSATVGTNWDVKELILRDWGGIIGPESSLHLIARWRKGEEDFMITTVVVDPFNVIADFTDFRTPSKTAGVTETTLSLRKPLRPGKWKIIFFIERDFSKPMMELEFYVTPLEYKKGMIGDPRLETINAGVIADDMVNAAGHNLYTIQTTLNYRRNNQQAQDTQQKSKSIKGPLLQRWIDQLVSSKWNVRDVCITSKDAINWSSSQITLPSGCDVFMPNAPTSCENLHWSSLTSDPKSKLGPVRSNGRIR